MTSEQRPEFDREQTLAGAARIDAELWAQVPEFNDPPTAPTGLLETWRNISAGLRDSCQKILGQTNKRMTPRGLVIVLIALGLAGLFVTSGRRPDNPPHRRLPDAPRHSAAIDDRPVGEPRELVVDDGPAGVADIALTSPGRPIGEPSRRPSQTPSRFVGNRRPGWASAESRSDAGPGAYPPAVASSDSAWRHTSPPTAPMARFLGNLEPIELQADHGQPRTSVH